MTIETKTLNTQPTMTTADHTELDIQAEIQSLLGQLGQGKVNGTAYDTAWTARLASRYPTQGFDASLDWLRQNQYEDGTWGAPVMYYHDRFVSTLAAIIALREVGRGPRDQRRVKRGERALWHLVAGLRRDDSDTVGFPILSMYLVEEARSIGLDVPAPPIRYARAYKAKVERFLSNKDRDWMRSPLTFSLEALHTQVQADESVLTRNNSVAISPAATAGYLLTHHDADALAFLDANVDGGSASVPALAPIDIFEVAWSLTHLSKVGAIKKDDPEVQKLLKFLWQQWNPTKGVAYSSYFGVTDVDDTAACYAVLKWGGYDVHADVFTEFEMDGHFCCYHEETDPALSAHVRLLMALRLSEDHPRYPVWIKKTINALKQMDNNGSFWTDKWHSSPYYVNSAALNTLRDISGELAYSRFKWILRTQNDDGGWGYYETSTLEETAYCLHALLEWDRDVTPVDESVLRSAEKFLKSNYYKAYEPLWIGKSLYTPEYVIKSAVLSALHGLNVKFGKRL